jgi:hypothetical protein
MITAIPNIEGDGVLDVLQGFLQRVAAAHTTGKGRHGGGIARLGLIGY